MLFLFRILTVGSFLKLSWSSYSSKFCICCCILPFPGCSLTPSYCISWSSSPISCPAGNGWPRTWSLLIWLPLPLPAPNLLRVYLCDVCLTSFLFGEKCSVSTTPPTSYAANELMPLAAATAYILFRSSSESILPTSAPAYFSSKLGPRGEAAL